MSPRTTACLYHFSLNHRIDALLRRMEGRVALAHSRRAMRAWGCEAARDRLARDREEALAGLREAEAQVSARRKAMEAEAARRGKDIYYEEERRALLSQTQQAFPFPPLDPSKF